MAAGAARRIEVECDMSIYKAIEKIPEGSIVRKGDFCIKGRIRKHYTIVDSEKRSIRVYKWMKGIAIVSLIATPILIGVFSVLFGGGHFTGHDFLTGIEHYGESFSNILHPHLIPLNGLFYGSLGAFAVGGVGAGIAFGKLRQAKDTMALEIEEGRGVYTVHDLNYEELATTGKDARAEARSNTESETLSNCFIVESTGETRRLNVVEASRELSACPHFTITLTSLIGVDEKTGDVNYLGHKVGVVEGDYQKIALEVIEEFKGKFRITYDKKEKMIYAVDYMVLFKINEESMAFFSDDKRLSNLKYQLGEGLEIYERRTVVDLKTKKAFGFSRKRSVDDFLDSSALVENPLGVHHDLASAVAGDPEEASSPSS
jgi:hypothetical protein